MKLNSSSALKSIQLLCQRVQRILSPSMTEAFAAWQTGAHALKLFPVGTLGLSTIKAWRAVLPSHTKKICVGGVTEHNASHHCQAGAPGISKASLHRKAKAAIQAWNATYTAAQNAPTPALAMELES